MQMYSVNASKTSFLLYATLEDGFILVNWFEYMSFVTNRDPFCLLYCKERKRKKDLVATQTDGLIAECISVDSRLMFNDMEIKWSFILDVCVYLILSVIF